VFSQKGLSSFVRYKIVERLHHNYNLGLKSSEIQSGLISLCPIDAIQKNREIS